MIPDEAIRAGFIACYERDHVGGIGSADVRRILEAAAPALIAALANEREGDLFRFTLSQREWLRKGLAK